MSTAYTIRSSISKYYTELNDCFKGQGYRRSPGDELDGKPALASVVTKYIISLRKRKVQAGEHMESAKALTPSDMKSLYTHCKTKGARGARNWVCRGGLVLSI